ncbi:MAG: hypothetical protein IJO83_00215 [Clostridia bacterium]|nr:hypothetical protein [Clostridia bacterium]
MRANIYKFLNRVYGFMMSVSFFAGFLPLIPFIFAIIIGGEIGEAIAVFLYKQYYPVVIILGCLAVVVGWVAMYVGKIEAFSVKKTVATEDSGKKDE